MSNVKSQILGKVATLLDKFSNRLVRIANQTQQNTNIIVSLQYDHNQEVTERKAAIQEIATRLQQDFSRQQTLLDRIKEVEFENNKREEAQTLRDQSNVQSLVSLRESTQKSFTQVRIDVEELMKRIQRLNERAGQVESRTNAIAQQTLSAEAKKHTECYRPKHRELEAGMCLRRDRRLGEASSRSGSGNGTNREFSQRASRVRAWSPQGTTGCRAVNRRSFFKKLGIGMAVAAVAPSAFALMEPTCVAPKAYATYIMGKDAVMTSYVDYVNFSEMALSKALDESFSNAAEEMAYRSEMSINSIIKEYQPVAFGRF